MTASSTPPLALRPIALIGLRCSGKSTLGKALAEALKRPFFDLDLELSSHARHKGGPPIPAGELFQILGERPFRALEARCLERLLRREPAAVIATGGGVVEHPQARALLSERTLAVWLQVDPVELARRMRSDLSLRPPLLGVDALAEIPEVAQRRAPLYSAVAHFCLDCGHETIASLVQRLLTLLAE